MFDQPIQFDNIAKMDIEALNQYEKRNYYGSGFKHKIVLVKIAILKLNMKNKRVAFFKKVAFDGVGQPLGYLVDLLNDRYE